jgi:hypothetical protein
MLAGEIYEGLHLSQGANDGAALLKDLAHACKVLEVDNPRQDADDSGEQNERRKPSVGPIHHAGSSQSGQGRLLDPLLLVLLRLRGPYAFVFWHQASKSLYFAKDPLGRRSLLLQRHTDYLVLSSTAPSSRPERSRCTKNEAEVANASFRTRDLAFPSSVEQGLESGSVKQAALKACCGCDEHRGSADRVTQVPCSKPENDAVVGEGEGGFACAAPHTTGIVEQSLARKSYEEVIPGLYRLSLGCQGSGLRCKDSTAGAQQAPGQNHPREAFDGASGSTCSAQLSLSNSAGMHKPLATPLINASAVRWNIECLSECEQYKNWQRVLCQDRSHIGAL